MFLWRGGISEILGPLFFFFFCLLKYHGTCGRGLLLPQPRIKRRPWHWKHQVLTTEPPRNSHWFIIFADISHSDFLKLVYFNYRLIALQYCGGFCHTSTWISHGCACVSPPWTRLPPPSRPHPSGLSQNTGFECPASCIELALGMYFTYGNIHVSMLFYSFLFSSPYDEHFQQSFFKIDFCDSVPGSFLVFLFSPFV